MDICSKPNRYTKIALNEVNITTNFYVQSIQTNLTQRNADTYIHHLIKVIYNSVNVPMI